MRGCGAASAPRAAAEALGARLDPEHSTQPHQRLRIACQRHGPVLLMQSALTAIVLRPYLCQTSAGICFIIMPSDIPGPITLRSDHSGEGRVYH